jgi:hypothetical protein
MSSEKEWKEVEGILVPIKYVSGLPCPLVQKNIADFNSRLPSATYATYKEYYQWGSDWILQPGEMRTTGVWILAVIRIPFRYVPKPDVGVSSFGFLRVNFTRGLTDITVSFSAPDVRQRHKEVRWNDDRVVRHSVRILESFAKHSRDSLYLYIYLWFI